MTGLIVFVVIAVIIVLWVISIYNSLVRLRNNRENAFADIDVQLKQRYDLVPQLVETVKGYAKHEENTFKEVTEARAYALAASSGAVQDVAQAENVLNRALRSLFAVSENYPQLRASENFLQLQEQLAELEDAIQASRRYYNGTARDQNNRVLQFPGNLVARAFGFGKIEYFELADPAEATVPEVKF